MSAPQTAPSADPGATQRYRAAHAWLPDGPARDVLIEVSGGRLTRIQPDAGSDAGPDPQRDGAQGATTLPGMVLPGLANAHSHAFHRALRGRTHHGGGTFWTWREAMYAVAARLDPDTYLALARATFAEMALAGVTSVGEFHYVHHGPGGTPYAEPNAMGEALRQAAADAGIRLTLLDTCYLRGGLGAGGYEPLSPAQARFGDGDADRWAARVAGLADDATTRIGAAVHSVRAVPADQLATVVQAAAGRPLHVHLSEQPAENEACLAAHGRTPAALLAEHGFWGPDATAVHATHLTEGDIALLGGARASACFCPTTERDLADGIGPARALADAGARIGLGSDQHAVIDLLEEARALEMHERLDTLQRGRFTPAQLLDAATAHAGLGWADTGRLEVGARADLVEVRLDTVRTAGCEPGQVLLAATAADVRTVVRDGEVVVAEGTHRLGDVGRLLSEAVEPLWRDA